MQNDPSHQTPVGVDAGAAPADRRHARRRVLAGVVALAFLVAIQWAISVGEPRTAPVTGVDEIEFPLRTLADVDFVEGIDHAWLPLTSRTDSGRLPRWEYGTGRGVDPDAVQATLEVLDEEVQVGGVPVTSLRWTQGDEPATTLLLAQERRGHVWLLGVRSEQADDSWTVADGRPAGLLLPAQPRRGDGYAVAYDRAAGVRVSATVLEVVRDVEGERTVDTPAGVFDDVVRVQWADVPTAAAEIPRRITPVLARGSGPVMVESGTGRTLRLLRRGS